AEALARRLERRERLIRRDPRLPPSERLRASLPSLFEEPAEAIDRVGVVAIALLLVLALTVGVVEPEPPRQKHPRPPSAFHVLLEALIAAPGFFLRALDGAFRLLLGGSGALPQRLDAGQLGFR